MALMEQEAKRRACLFWWTKIQSAAHRGEPDVQLRVTLPRLPVVQKLIPSDYIGDKVTFNEDIAHTTVYGPDAHIEFKRGNNWPTKAQNLRAAGKAKCGVPCYLIQLKSKELAFAWKYPMEGAMEAIYKETPAKLWLYPMTSGTWIETATILMDYISRK